MHSSTDQHDADGSRASDGFWRPPPALDVTDPVRGVRASSPHRPLGAPSRFRRAFAGWSVLHFWGDLRRYFGLAFVGRVESNKRLDWIAAVADPWYQELISSNTGALYDSAFFAFPHLRSLFISYYGAGPGRTSTPPLDALLPLDVLR